MNGLCVTHVTTAKKFFSIILPSPPPSLSAPIQAPAAKKPNTGPSKGGSSGKGRGGPPQVSHGAHSLWDGGRETV